MPKKTKVEKAEILPANTTRITLSNDVVARAKEAARLLAPQFDMPAQAAVEGVLTFGYEQAYKLQEQSKAVEEQIRLAQSIVQAVTGGSQLPSHFNPDPEVGEGVVKYNTITDEGKEFVL
jgi:hypothetical protein